METEVRIARRDRLLTPRNRLAVNVDAIIATAEVIAEAQRQIPDAASDVEYPVFGPQPAIDELRPYCARAGEYLRTPRLVIVQATSAPAATTRRSST